MLCGCSFIVEVGMSIVLIAACVWCLCMIPFYALVIAGKSADDRLQSMWKEKEENGIHERR